MREMDRTTILRAWVALLVFSLLSTLIAAAVGGGRLDAGLVAGGGTATLLLAWMKARVILSDYLGLRAAPFWRRGFMLVLTIYALVLAGLYLAPLA